MGGSWYDCRFWFLQNNLYFVSLTLQQLTSLQSEQTNFSIFLRSSLIGGTRSPILWILSLLSLSAFTVSRAAFFPFPAKELSVSHPVSACSPSSARHTLTPSCSQTWVTLMTGARLLVPLRRKMSSLMYSRKEHANTSTSVSNDLIKIC